MTTDRDVAIDVTAMLTIGLAVCVASQRWAVMTALVASVALVRLLLRRDLAFFAFCVVLGGGNDLLTVERYHVYHYAVPSDLWSIPVWMLLYWGIILRAIASLATWPRLGEARPQRSIVLQLALVLATRQAIYRLWNDPIWSWLPFALALALYLALRPSRRALAVAGLALLLGPPVEIAFIHLGHLHRYALGWLGGVPLWIALWWALGVFVWVDLAPRIERALTRSRDDRCHVATDARGRRAPAASSR